MYTLLEYKKDIDIYNNIRKIPWIRFYKYQKKTHNWEIKNRKCSRGEELNKEERKYTIELI